MILYLRDSGYDQLAKCINENTVLKRQIKNAQWQPIDTFDQRMFSIMTNGTPDGTEVFKYKGYIPEKFTHWKPLLDMPEENKMKMEDKLAEAIKDIDNVLKDYHNPIPIFALKRVNNAARMYLEEHKDNMIDYKEENIMINEILRPCPFCGGEAVSWSPHEDAYYIGCKNDCIPSFHGIYNEKEEMVLKAWNTRVDIQWQDVSTYKGEKALLGFWTKNIITKKTHFEVFLLYADENNNLRTIDKYGDYFSEYSYNDIACWFPIPKSPEEE